MSAAKAGRAVPEVYRRWLRVDQPKDWAGPSDGLIDELWREKSDEQKEFWRSLDAAHEPRPAPELAARRTAAAAVLGDYTREAAGAETADLALWAARMADMLRHVLAVLDDGDRAAAQFPTAAVQLAEIRLVLEAFDWETDDRQYALEQIGEIVNGGAA
jgi:hypothetical protein